MSHIAEGLITFKCKVKFVSNSSLVNVHCVLRKNINKRCCRLVLRIGILKKKTDLLMRFRISSSNIREIRRLRDMFHTKKNWKKSYSFLSQVRSKL